MTSTSNVSSAVEEVKIFLRGAEIKRRMTAETVKGKNIAVFDGLPQDIRPESINASIERGGTLVSADFEVDSFKEPYVSKELAVLVKKLEGLKESVKKEKSRLSILASEEKFLESNMKIGGDSGFLLNELIDIEKYFRERKEAISVSRLETDRKLEELTKETERVTKEIGTYPSDGIRYAGKIIIEFHSDDVGKAEIVVSYYVGSAWWRPFHEIRMNEIGAPVVLSMKGNVIQNTGEDWNDVAVRLSTGNPSLGSQQPILRPWYIDLVMPQKPTLLRAKALSMDMECLAECGDAPEVRSMAAPAVQIVESNTSAEFILPGMRSIPSSDRPSRTDISKHELKADVMHYCASKLDTDAFLIAKIGGWQSLNLLAGEVGIFQGNEYVGKTYLDPAAAEDDMEISLGRDKGVVVTRERGNDMTSKGMMSKNATALREWIITVRNARNRAIRIRLTDQLPVSVNSSITVDAVELSGAEVDKETGILSWMLDIPAGGSVRKVLKYEVTYPKNGTVYLN
ncbi:MAG: DUF4139 domain-containing protein [Methanomassiliicoccaceae archaeon]|jgi:uncharacterized protein (TIGR02231 family)|nr:DUF4139 domain-containing protein [Methanomassiliicoccaceae archaeon]